MITENGLGEFDKLTADDRVQDDDRIAYLQSHLKACQEAMQDGSSSSATAPGPSPIS